MDKLIDDLETLSSYVSDQYIKAVLLRTARAIKTLSYQRDFYKSLTKRLEAMILEKNEEIQNLCNALMPKKQKEEP